MLTEYQTNERPNGFKLNRASRMALLWTGCSVWRDLEKKFEKLEVEGRLPGKKRVEMLI